jgi:hypothetical protein
MLMLFRRISPVHLVKFCDRGDRITEFEFGNINSERVIPFAQLHLGGCDLCYGCGIEIIYRGIDSVARGV